MGLEHKRVVYKRLRVVLEGFIDQVKDRLDYVKFTWQGLKNDSIHVSLFL